MGLADAIAAKLQRVKQDYEQNRSLDKAAHTTYEHVYHEEYGKARIKAAVAKAKKEARAAANTKTNTPASPPFGFNPAGFNSALEMSVLGEAPEPKARRKSRKKHNPKKRHKKKPAPQGEYYNPFF